MPTSELDDFVIIENAVVVQNTPKITAVALSIIPLVGFGSYTEPYTSNHIILFLEFPFTVKTCQKGFLLEECFMGQVACL